MEKGEHNGAFMSENGFAPNQSDTDEVRRNFRDAQQTQQKVQGNGSVTDIIRLDDVLGHGRHSVVYKGSRTGGYNPDTGPWIVVVKHDGRDFKAEHTNLDRKFDSLWYAGEYPYIPKLQSLIPDEVRNQWFIVMEYVEGISVRQYLKRKKFALQGLALSWTCQILDALAYLHKGRRIHGALQAENVLLKRIQDKGRPKEQVFLLDYNLDVDDWTETDNELIVHDIFGKVESDEAFQEGVRKDIRDTGNLLFLMLTGEDVMEGQDRKQALNQAHVTERVQKVVLTAMDNGYNSAEEMLKKLRLLSVTDLRKIYIHFSRIASFIVAMGIFLAGVHLYMLGGDLIAQTAQHEQEVAQVEQAARDAAQIALNRQNQYADYSGALNYAINAAKSPNIPDAVVPPEAQSTLAEILSVYDFTPGYKPLHSESVLLGNPLRVRLSPDGRYVAVLVENGTTEYFRIQVFDVKSGKETKVVFVDGVMSDFVIRADGTLIYAGRNGVTAYNLDSHEERILSEPVADSFFDKNSDPAQAPEGFMLTPDGRPAQPPVAIALTPDGQTATVLYRDEQTVITYPVGKEPESYFLRLPSSVVEQLESKPQPMPDGRNPNPSGGPIPPLKPDGQTPDFNQEPIPLPDDVPAPKDDIQTLNHFLALADDGIHLVLSSQYGGLFAYRLDKPDESPVVLLEGTMYDYFEGGFYTDASKKAWFLCVGGVIDISADWRGDASNLPANLVGSAKVDYEPPESHFWAYEVTELDKLDSKADFFRTGRLDGTPHMAVDLGGVYISSENLIYRFQPDKGSSGTLGTALKTNGDILFFRHDSHAKRLLSVTENEIVMLFEESEETIDNWATDTKGSQLINGIAFLDGCLCQDYALLLKRDKISVLHWDEKEWAVEYPLSDGHDASYVRRDETGRILSILLTDRMGFRIYNVADGADNSKPETAKAFEGVGSILEVRYRREIGGDYLEVVYENRIDRYSAKNGELTSEETKSVSASGVYEAAYDIGAFHVTWKPRESVVVSSEYGRRSFDADMVCVSGYENWLLLSLKDSDDSYRSLLLNERCEQLAELSGQCELMPDGTLYADNRQGRIFQTSVRTLEELRQEATDRRNGIG